MELSPIVLQWREEARQEGERVVIENLLKVRFGELDEQLATIIEPVMELPPEDIYPAATAIVS